MTLRYRDRVVDVTATTGTGTLTLSALPPAGYRDFGAFPTGSTVRYTIVHANNTEWEVGEGVWTTSGATLTRVTVFASSNAGALVDFTVGAKTVSASPVARDVERPAFRAHRATTNQTISGYTWTKVQLNSIAFDTAGGFDATTNFRYTAPVAGYYHITGVVGMTAFGDELSVSIYKNGAASLSGPTVRNSPRTTAVDLVYLNGTTDYVELWVFGAATVVSAGASGTVMAGVLVAPAP